MNAKQTIPVPGEVILRDIRKSVKQTSKPYAWMREYRVPLDKILICTLILQDYWRGHFNRKRAIQLIKRVHPLAGNPRYLKAIISTPAQLGRIIRIPHR